MVMLQLNVRPYIKYNQVNGKYSQIKKIIQIKLNSNVTVMTLDSYTLPKRNKPTSLLAPQPNTTVFSLPPLPTVPNPDPRASQTHTTPNTKPNTTQTHHQTLTSSRLGTWRRNLTKLHNIYK